MRKQEFLNALEKRLSGLPRQDVVERLEFYSEMIDDRIEEGIAEEDAVSAIGSVGEIVAQTVADIPLARIVKESIRPKKSLGAREIVLLALGFPIWFSLLLAAFAVVLALYASLWSVTVSLWAVFASLVASALVGIVAGVVFAIMGNGLAGIALVGAGLACAGLAIFLLVGSKAGTRGILLLTKKMGLGIKRCFVKGEVA